MCAQNTQQPDGKAAKPMANTEIDFCVPSIIRKLRIFNANLRNLIWNSIGGPIKFSAAKMGSANSPGESEIRHKRKVENILQLCDPFVAGQIKLAPSQTSINQQPRILRLVPAAAFGGRESIYNICKLDVQRGV